MQYADVQVLLPYEALLVANSLWCLSGPFVTHNPCGTQGRPPFFQVEPSDAEGYEHMVELWFLFCLLWSVCASVDEDGRKLIDGFIREMEGQFPAKVRFRSCVDVMCMYMSLVHL